MRRRSAFAATLAFALGAAMVGAAPGGAARNDPAAKACQKGGWQERRSADGGAFRNPGDCVSYAARGGSFAPPAPACFDSSQPGLLDVALTGPVDTLSNATVYLGSDGSCAVIATIATVVSASTAADAAAKCETLDALAFSGAAQLVSFGYGAPTDYWFCI